MRATHLEVKIDQFLQNVDLIQKYVGRKEIMPVMKANAYGTYLNHNLDVLKRFSIVAVAFASEGIQLRKIGYEGDIFVLNQPSIDDINDIENYHLTVGLSDIDFLEECIKRKVSFPVHFEIETGMNRTGIALNDLEDFIKLFHTSSLKLEGIYSHFSSADFDEDYTNRQIDLFENAYLLCKEKGLSFKYIHISASNGLLNYKLPFTNLVRPGILLYGYESFPGSLGMIPVKPVCTLKSEITFLKNVLEGEKIGYSQTYTCLKDSVIATIPIGYGDGYRRCLSNKGKVYLNGRFAPIVGSVCMDSIMIDVTGIPCHVGNSVYLMDNDNISLEDLSKMCDTINYEVLCTIGERVPRIFIGGEYGERS